MTEVLRIEGEDLNMVVKDGHDCLVRIDAKGWLDREDMVNLVDFLLRSIRMRTPDTGDQT